MSISYINDAQHYKNTLGIFFKLMLGAIGSVMHGNNMASKFCGKCFILPICTGTSAIDIYFLSTEHPQELLD